MKQIIAGLALAASVAAAARADVVIYVDDVNGQIGTVNITTGQSTVIGGTGKPLTDIAFDKSGNLYGISFALLYGINQTTGAATLIGALNANNMNGLVGNPAGGLLASNNVTKSIYSIDTATGAATALSGGSPLTSAGDLAFNGGSLYEAATNGGFTDLVRLTITGSTVSGTDVGRIVNDANLYGLVQGSDGVLYGVDGTTVYAINPTTAVPTVVVANYATSSRLGAAQGAATFTEASNPPGVPAPAMPAAFGLALAALGLTRVRR